MSQRAFILSIVAIVSFVATTLYAADQIAGRVSSVSPVCNCQQPAAAPDTDRFNHAMAFAVYSELNEANTRDLVIASREHPDLAPELRYQAFSAAVNLHRSFQHVDPGAFKHVALGQDPFFAADFAALKDRYQREHPTDKEPIE